MSPTATRPVPPHSRDDGPRRARARRRQGSITRLGGWRHRLLDAKATLRPLAPGVKQLTLSTRMTLGLGMLVTPYLVGSVLIDTGFSIVGDMVHAALAEERIDVICCTHQHEDHTGNAGPLALERRCPLYMYRPELRWSEGVTRHYPYRSLVWGSPHPYSPQPIPERIDAGQTTLRRVLATGHSATQVALLDEEMGWIYISDLYISGGVAPVMPQEAPREQVASLRRVAALEPERMLNGHGGVWDQPAQRLRVKADRIEEKMAEVLSLHDQGLDENAIYARVFPGTWREETLWRGLTTGEFSRHNFVRACLRDARL